MNNWEHLSTSWTNLRISIEYFWSIEGILRTSENSWEHRKTSKIIWYHPKNNWRPIIDNLVQLEEDFNSRTEMWSGVGWGYLRSDQFLNHLTVIITAIWIWNRSFICSLLQNNIVGDRSVHNKFIIHSDSLRLKKGFYEKLEPQGILQGHHGHNTTGLEQNSVHLLIGNEELHICCTKIEKDSTPQFSSSPPDLPGTNHLHLRWTSSPPHPSCSSPLST